MSKYKLVLGKTLKYSSPSVAKFWLRDFPKRLYSIHSNAEVLRDEYQAVIIQYKEHDNSYIVFRDAETYMRFQLEWT